MKTTITESMKSRVVAQVSKPAVSPISKSAGRSTPCGPRVWKPAIQQTWKSTLQFGVAVAFLVAVTAPAETVSLESAAPVVVKTVPVAGATSVDPGLTEIKVTYSKNMQDGSWSWSTWGEENYPETTGQPRYLSDGRTCVLPVKLQPAKFYAIWLNSDKFKNFRDAGGQPAVPYLLSFRTGEAGGGGGGHAPADFTKLLNDDQRAVLAWTDRQFKSFFDARTFDGWSNEERATLEKKLIDSLSGPRSTEYYQAINTLAALRSTKALSRLREIAFEHVDRNNRDRWMAIRALGMIGDKADVPELIHLVYHGNVNTRWWAQISLVRLTGQNFAKDWNAWGKWWNGQNGQPPFKPEVIRWWNGQAEPDKLAESLEESDQKFFESLKSKSATTPASASSTEVATRLRTATPVMEGIRGAWSAAVEAIQREDMTSALASLRTLAPRIQEFRDTMKGTALEAGAAETLETLKPLMSALEKGDLEAARTAMAPIMALGRKMEEQVKAITDASPVAKDPFANCRIASFGGEKSEGQQSYGGSGPAIRFKPAEVLSDVRADKPVTLIGVRLYASRYGGGYSPEETKLRVILRDAKDATLAETGFAYAKFGYKAGWVDLVFDKPVRIQKPAEPVTIALDPEATQSKGIYFHYQKNPATSHSLAGTVSDGFKELPDREWMVRACFE